MRPSILVAAWLAGTLPVCGCSVMTSYDGLEPPASTAASTGSGGASTSSANAGPTTGPSSGPSTGPGGGGDVGSGGAGGGGGGAPPMGYADIVLQDHPLAYWRLGESQGLIAADATKNGNNGSYSGDFQLGVSGAISGDPDTAAGFYGGGQVLVADLFDFTEHSPFSVEAWVRVHQPRPPGEHQTVCAKLHADNGVVDGYSISTSEGGVGFGRWSHDGWDGGDGVGGPLGAEGSYSHVVGTYDGTTMYMYVNGGQVDGSGSDKWLDDRSDAFVIGADNGGWDEHMDGDVDDVAVYDYALPSDRVAAHYQAGVR